MASLMGVFLVGAFSLWLFMEQKKAFQITAASLSPVKKNVHSLNSIEQRQARTIQSLQKQLKSLQTQLKALRDKFETQTQEQSRVNVKQNITNNNHGKELRHLHTREADHTQSLKSLAQWRAAADKRAAAMGKTVASNHKELGGKLRQFRASQTSFNQKATGRLAQLKDATGKLKAHTGKLQGASDAHKAQLAALGKTLKPLPKSVAELQKKSKANAAELKRLVTASQARTWMFTRMAAELKPVHKGIKTLNKRLEHTGKRIKALEATARNHRLVVSNVSSTLPSAMHLLKTLSSELNEQKQKLKRLRKALKKLKRK